MINIRHNTEGVNDLSVEEQYQLFILFDNASQTLIELMEFSHSRCVKGGTYIPGTPVTP